MAEHWHLIAGYVATQQGFALSRIESLFFGGMKGEVWIQPGKPASQVSQLSFSLVWLKEVVHAQPDGSK